MTQLEAIKAPAKLIAASLLLAGATSAAAQDVRWQASTWGTPRAATAGAEAWAEEIARRTDGAFQISIHYGGELSAPRNNLDNLQLGAFEVANYCGGFHPGKHPASMVVELPFLPFEDLANQRAAHEAVYSHPTVEAELARWNAKWMLSSVLPQMELIGRGEAVDSVAGIEGLRVRALGPLGSAYAKAGAVPMSLSAPETYQALSQGVLDSVAIAHYAMDSYRLYEPSDWVTENLAPGTVNCPWVVSISAWEALPQAYRDIALESRDMAYAAYADAYGEAGDGALEAFREDGLTVVSFSEAEREKFRDLAGVPLWQEWIAEAEAKGLPGQELFDRMMAAIPGK
ncbi:TRAP transporter substrate-binding protein DctP [Marinovum sp.]|uniref:TRAP transporter substrate-binding protein DctP n=1 Tax=Marinovum sp. TaxID=2024839 RepID=UPI002B273EF8|nr:TRAP transporter substrate-binding protein DctP [Marinovum sp.]